MTRISYQSLEPNTYPLSVEVFRPEHTSELAEWIPPLIVAAYSAQFEGGGKPLPAGAFAAVYDTDKAVERFRNRTIPHVFDRGGAYLGIHDPELERGKGGLVSILKMLPGHVIEPRFEGMAGIAEILTHPSYQRQGHASALLHSRLKYFELPTARVMLDAFDGSPVNGWYKRRLGLEDEAASGELELSQEHALPTHYMVSPVDVTVASLVRRLENRLPALAAGQLYP